MTIIEAIKEVLKFEPKGLSSVEIYQRIIDQNLYQFGAKNPVGVVNGEIRRHCIGLDFPTAYPVKHFAIAGKEGKKLKFIVRHFYDFLDVILLKTIRKYFHQLMYQ